MKNREAITANDITARILKEQAIRFPGSRLFRRNVGTFYGVDVVRAARRTLVEGSPAAALAILTRARPITCGLPGEPDCDGFVPVRVGGKLVGVRIGCEVKITGDKLTVEQALYREMSREGGCIWIEARSPEQYFEELEDVLVRLKV